MKKLLILILISLALNNLQTTSAGGVGYDSANLYNKKSLKLTVTPVDYNQSIQKWSYKISWDRQTKKGGSFLIKDIVYVVDASGKGEVQTDFNLKAKSKYSVVYYSKNNKKGTVVFRKSFKTLPAPNSISQTNTTRNLNWLIVFTNTGERLPDAIKNDLCTENSTNKLSYLPNWFKRESNKYGVSLSVSLNCYSQQIELPQNVLANPDRYTAFGQQIPLPLNMEKTSDYILQNIPSSRDYNLITVVNYTTSGGRVADMSSIGGKVSFVFIVKSNFVDGIQYYAPNITEPNIKADANFVKSVAHEALHNLGAFDHYDYLNPAVCLTETDQTIKYISPRIMCATNFNNFADYIISSETAKEIGWTN